MRREVGHTVGYIAIQLGSVASSLVALRWGSAAFGSAWVLGAMLAMGWGATVMMLLTPALPARMWTIPFGQALRSSSAGLGASALVCALAVSLPPTSAIVSSLAGIGALWVLVFFLVGLIRHTVQVATTLIVRQGLHRPLLDWQGVGRGAEIVALGIGCRWPDVLLFCVAWLVYPALQLLALWLVPGVRDPAPARGEPAEAVAGGAGEAANLASSVLDLVVPTLWLRVGGEAAYVAYRGMTAAVGYVVLVPRYWYVVVSTSLGTIRERRPYLAAATMALSLVGAFCYQWMSGLVPLDMMLWSAIPVLASAGSATMFSRLRQLCLQRGDITSPALATVAARVTEAALLMLFARVIGLGPHVIILAYCASALGAVLLRWRVGARQETSERHA